MYVKFNILRCRDFLVSIRPIANRLKSHFYHIAVRPVILGLNLEQIAIEGFLAWTCSLGPSDEHIKSLQLFDTGKVVNLHKFKMAAIQRFNL